LFQHVEIAVALGLDKLPAGVVCNDLLGGAAAQGQRSYQISCRPLALCASLTTAGGMLASCDTPIGVSPAPQGTYRATSIVTNPDGDGPQVVRRGPPEGITGRH